MDERKKTIGQDFMEFYEDENWGAKDYPISEKETLETLYPTTQPESTSVQPTVTQPSVPEVIEPVKASIFDRIPKWAWVVMALGVAYLIFRKRR